ncbi:MAG: efflux RND transporter periplasmic adaptor subunit [Alphaproteobacteria bacterium]|nr:efflux RND transporter periplasmic adaptor subunit [Alphaproteobacteria bacterium]
MLYLLTLGCAPPETPPTVTAARGDLQVRVEVKGELEAVTSTPLGSRIKGWHEIEFLVEDGTRVEEGDELLRIAVDELEKEKVELEGELEAARTRVEQASARLAIKLGAARAKVVEAELDAEIAALRRTGSLTVPRVERESARIAAEQAQMTIDSAATDRDRLLLESKAEVQLLELEATAKSARLEDLEHRIGLASVVAPADGLAILAKKWDGELFKVGEEAPLDYTVLRLTDIQRLQVVAWVHEVDAPRVTTEQPARILVDAHPDKPLTGSVEEVAPLAVAHGDHDEKHLKVVIALDGVEAGMKPGMTVTAELLVRSVDDGVLLPSGSVFSGSDGPVVYLPDGEPVHVRVVADDGEKVAVQGIEAGTDVLTIHPEAWARGERPEEGPE